MLASGAIVCFGELLLRLNAPGRERLMQSPHFDAHVGGAEANVAVSLAQFGENARMATTLADNALGAAALGALRRYGVDISNCRSSPGRMGLYFMSNGAVRRPSEILYDRAGSAFAEAPAASYDWPAILKGASWLHVSGITPAVGPKAAEAALGAARAARALGVKLSFDGNYRAQLWAAWAGDGPAILREILSNATLAFVNERDAALILGRDYGTGEAARAAARADLFAAFPSIELIAATTRSQESVDDHDLGAEIHSRTAAARAPAVSLSSVIDRIGAGDAFAAGVLYALNNARDLAFAVAFGAAAAAFKHSIKGDFSIASLADIEAAMRGEGLDVRR